MKQLCGSVLLSQYLLCLEGLSKTVCTQYDFKIILYKFNYLLYIHNIKTVNQVLTYPESAQISFMSRIYCKIM